MAEKKEKIINLMRLAYKAKEVALGKVAVEKSISKNKTGLIFSGKKNNNFIRKKAEICKQKNIHISFVFSDEELSKIFGRRKLTVASINNENFANGMKEIMGI